MGDLLDKYGKPRLSKADEKLTGELGEKLDDLTDIDVFVPMEMKKFRQFTELVRILGLIYLVSIFEGYLVDIVREILLTRPDALKSGKQLTVEEILAQGERKQIISYFAEREVEDLQYDSFSNVVKYFEDKFKINLNNSGVSVESVTEILATRNIHIHNKGMVNQKF